jgi:hypothetical protein
MKRIILSLFSIFFAFTVKATPPLPEQDSNVPRPSGIVFHPENDFFEQFPLEIIYLIFSYLKAKDFGHFSRTNTTNKALVASARHDEREKAFFFQQAFGLGLHTKDQIESLLDKPLPSLYPPLQRFIDNKNLEPGIYKADGKEILLLLKKAKKGDVPFNNESLYVYPQLKKKPFIPKPSTSNPSLLYLDLNCAGLAEQELDFFKTPSFFRFSIGLYRITFENLPASPIANKINYLEGYEVENLFFFNTSYEGEISPTVKTLLFRGPQNITPQSLASFVSRSNAEKVTFIEIEKKFAFEAGLLIEKLTKEKGRLVELSFSILIDQEPPSGQAQNYNTLYQEYRKTHPLPQ